MNSKHVSLKHKRRRNYPVEMHFPYMSEAFQWRYKAHITFPVQCISLKSYALL